MRPTIPQFRIRGASSSSTAQAAEYLPGLVLDDHPLQQVSGATLTPFSQVARVSSGGRAAVNTRFGAMSTWNPAVKAGESPARHRDSRLILTVRAPATLPRRSVSQPPGVFTANARPRMAGPGCHEARRVAPWMAGSGPSEVVPPGSSMQALIRTAPPPAGLVFMSMPKTHCFRRGAQVIEARRSAGVGSSGASVMQCRPPLPRLARVTPQARP